MRIVPEMRSTVARCVASILAASALLPSLCAQVDSPPFDAEASYRLDERGLVRYRLSPDLVDETLFDLADPESLDVLGPLLVLCLAMPGDSDLLGLTDSDRFFRNLGVGDADLLQLLAGGVEDEVPGVALRRSLAVRAVEQRGFRPAIGLLRRLVKQGSADSALVAEARGVLARLDGAEPSTEASARSLPTAVLLTGAPASANLLFSIDQTRIPRTAEFIHDFALLIRESMMARFEGGGFDDALLQSMAQRMFQAKAAVALGGYQLARQIGNHRVRRITGAVRIDERFGREPLTSQVVFEGTFDVSTLRVGLDEAGYRVAGLGDGEGLRIETSEFSLEVTSGVATLRSGQDGELIDVETARVWSEQLIGDGAFVLARSPDWQVPDMLSNWLPRRASVDVPGRVGEKLSFRLEYDAPASAEATAGILASVPRLAEPLVDEFDVFERLIEPLEKLQVRTDKTTLEASLEWPNLDLRQFVMDLAKTGLLR